MTPDIVLDWMCVAFVGILLVATVALIGVMIAVIFDLWRASR